MIIIIIILVLVSMLKHTFELDLDCPLGLGEVSGWMDPSVPFGHQGP